MVPEAGSMVRNAGSPVADQTWFAPLPPVVGTDCAYTVPTIPEGRDVALICNWLKILMVNCRVKVLGTGDESITCTVKE
jgi:hypothetical protein